MSRFVWLLLAASTAIHTTAHAADRRFARDLSRVYPPGPLLAAGSAQKLVYAVAGRRDLVLRVLGDAPVGAGKRGAGQSPAARAWLLAQEHDDLARLGDDGWPVLDIVATGHIDGRPADVVPRFVVGTKDGEGARGLHAPRSVTGGAAAWRTHFPDGLDDGMRADLHTVARRLVHGDLAAIDLQLLLAPGRAVVFDPAAVVSRATEPRRHFKVKKQDLRVVGRLLVVDR